jgi:hypothetical protein
MTSSRIPAVPAPSKRAAVVPFPEPPAGLVAFTRGDVSKTILGTPAGRFQGTSIVRIGARRIGAWKALAVFCSTRAGLMPPKHHVRST